MEMPIFVRNKNIEIRKAMVEDLPSVINLLKQMGWEAYTPHRDQFIKLLEDSFLSLVAVDKSQLNERIVGFARTVSDGLLNGYITMVAVEEEKRGQGIGKLMVISILKSSPQSMKWVLTSAKEGVGFWEKLGFIPDPHLMYRPRFKEGAVDTTPKSPPEGARLIRKVLRKLINFLSRFDK